MKRYVLLIILFALVLGGGILSQSYVRNPHGPIRWDCQDCHTTESWSRLRSPMQFDHARTGFALVGAHAMAPCISCHKNLTFSHVGSACADCHADQHGGQLGLDCRKCHAPRDWQNRRNSLELHAERGFALTGAHAVVDCDACHRGAAQQQFAGTPVDCYACHADAYDAAADPDHRQLGYSHDCRACHFDLGNWYHTNFSHPPSFPLVGGHKNVPCRSCHPGGYTGTPVECYACHLADFNSATDPNHQRGDFPHDCTTCHTVMGWRPARFDHSGTGFPLTGKHTGVTCQACHTSGYAGTPTDCYSCHQTAYQQATDPNHVLGNFDHDCTKCHTTAGWSPSSFDHSATAFPLTGQHVPLACSKCHASGFAGTPTDCYACHQAAYDAATDPNHAQQGFGHDCTQCHTTGGWSPSTFNHAATAFPLTGKHTALSCISCHASGYVSTPTACFACHQGVYQTSLNPNHALANFGQTCADCHTTDGWTPANWSHSSTGYTLTGAHLTQICSQCHATAYAGTPTACYGCHQASYNATTNPSHAAAAFPTTCETCHNTTNWTNTTWNHDGLYFPIYSGSHAGRWSVCADCHPNASSFAVFTCTTACHDQATTDSHHTQVSGYQYLSSACYSCHPTGATGG